MKSLLMTGMVLLCFIITSCQQTPIAVESSIPALLQRPTAIQNGKEWEHTQNIYASAKRNAATKPEASLQLAEVFITEARITGEHGHYYPAALKVLNKSLAKPTLNQDQLFSALSLKAGVLLSQHEFDTALQTAQKAVAINPYNAAIYGALVDAYVELGDYDQAVKMADKMISIRPDLRSYARVSYLREIHGQVEGAIESMNRAVEAGFPGYEETSWTRLTLGDLYKEYGELDKAKQQYQLALQERENYPFAIAALADIAMIKKEYTECEELLKKACAIIPEVGFYVQLAELYHETGRTADVLVKIGEIEEMLADDVLHGHNMNMEYADLHLNLTKNVDKALQYATLEYEKRPDNIDVNKLLASIYFAKEEFATAQQHLIIAQRTGSQNPQLLLIKKGLANQHNNTQNKDKLTYQQSSNNAF